MIKIIGVLKKRDELTHDEFVNYWFNSHAPKVKKLPGLRKYVLNPTTGQKLASRPVSTDYDGVAEMYFDDLDAAEKAFGSEQGKASAEDARHFIKDRIFLVVTENPVV